MTDTPNVSLDEQVVRALRGDGPPDMKLVSDYLKNLARAATSGNVTLVHVGVIDYLSQLLDVAGDSDLRLDVSRRKAGNPSSSYERARIGHIAFRIVEDGVANGMLNKVAVGIAMDQTGLSRSEVFEWLKVFRKMRANRTTQGLTLTFHDRT